MNDGEKTEVAKEFYDVKKSGTRKRSPTINPYIRDFRYFRKTLFFFTRYILAWKDTQTSKLHRTADMIKDEFR